MVALIIGVPDSGKSALAEDLSMELSGDGKRIYVATMEVLDEEGKKRVEKHRKLRDGKGFFTIEAPLRVSDAAKDIHGIGDCTVLLECISNLVGNVMHDEGFVKAALDNHKELVSAAAESVEEDVSLLCNKAKNTMLVTNFFPGDAEGYDEDTRQYVACLDEVNKRLRKIADVVYEFCGGEWIKSEDN